MHFYELFLVVNFKNHLVANVASQFGKQHRIASPIPGKNFSIWRTFRNEFQT